MRALMRAGSFSIVHLREVDVFQIGVSDLFGAKLRDQFAAFHNPNTRAGFFQPLAKPNQPLDL